MANSSIKSQTAGENFWIRIARNVAGVRWIQWTNRQIKYSNAKLLTNWPLSCIAVSPIKRYGKQRRKERLQEERKLIPSKENGFSLHFYNPQFFSLSVFLLRNNSIKNVSQRQLLFDTFPWRCTLFRALKHIALLNILSHSKFKIKCLSNYLVKWILWK